jgi:hypothetical protein
MGEINYIFETSRLYNFETVDDDLLTQFKIGLNHSQFAMASN